MTTFPGKWQDDKRLSDRGGLWWSSKRVGARRFVSSILNHFHRPIGNSDHYRMIRSFRAQITTKKRGNEAKSKREGVKEGSPA